MKTPFSIWAPSAIHRGSIMPLRTSMLEEMPTLMSQAAITSTITQHRAGTTQQGLAHQTSQALTRVYPTPWPSVWERNTFNARNDYRTSCHASLGRARCQRSRFLPVGRCHLQANSSSIHRQSAVACLYESHHNSFLGLSFNGHVLLEK